MINQQDNESRVFPYPQRVVHNDLSSGRDHNNVSAQDLNDRTETPDDELGEPDGFEGWMNEVLGEGEMTFPFAYENPGLGSDEETGGEDNFYQSDEVALNSSDSLEDLFQRTHAQVILRKIDEYIKAPNYSQKGNSKDLENQKELFVIAAELVKKYFDEGLINLAFDDFLAQLWPSNDAEIRQLMKEKVNRHVLKKMSEPKEKLRRLISEIDQLVILAYPLFKSSINIFALLDEKLVR